MRRISTLLVLGVLLGMPAVSAAKSIEMAQLLQRQKGEMKALKLKEKYQKESLKGQTVPKAVRDQMKHQMDREKRALRDRQKDERQDMKDRERMMKESMKLLPPS